MHTSAVFAPLRREVRGNARVFAIEADMKYAVGNSSVFRQGFAKLRQFGLSFDVWLYHPQLEDEILPLCRAQGVGVIDHPVGNDPAQGVADLAAHREKRQASA